jgi:hypothetical protein
MKYPLRIQLEEVLEVDDDVINVIRSISSNRWFGLEIWHDDVSRKIISEFKKKYPDINFTLLDKQESESTYSFYSIGMNNHITSSLNWRYKYQGDIISGIYKYKEMVEQINERAYKSWDSRK